MDYRTHPVHWPPRRDLHRPMIHPFASDKDCHLCLTHEINTKWRDQSGHGYDGTITGASKTMAGRYNHALYFDGVDDYVLFGDVLDVGTSAFSISVWAYFTDLTTQDGMIASKGHVLAAPGAADEGYVLRTESADQKLRFEVQDDANQDTVASTNALSTGQWYHIVAIADAGAVSYIYVNGVLDSPFLDISAIGEIQTALQFTVGAYSNNPNNFELSAYLDQMLFFMRVLTPEEIKWLYQYGRP